MSQHATQIRRLATDHAKAEGALLPILHAVQSAMGYLPPETAPIVADVLNISRADVHGVITFYHLFRTTKPGTRTLYVCRSEACQSMGANALADHIRNKLGIDWHETTDDGRVSLEPIYCLGNCACAPAVMVDTTLHGRVTASRLDEILD